MADCIQFRYRYRTGGLQFSLGPGTRANDRGLDHCLGGARKDSNDDAPSHAYTDGCGINARHLGGFVRSTQVRFGEEILQNR
ncbi:hypothetical protein [Sinomonas atrocyanea]|uniref:hypothetical protein n=1 Tax=Sinomonas atrocyanea TaxID=37927 RepID=UPI003D955B65